LQDDAEDMELSQLVENAPQPPLLATAEVHSVPKALRRQEAYVADVAKPCDTEDATHKGFHDYGGFSKELVGWVKEDLSHMVGVKEAGLSRKDFKSQEH